MNLFIQRRAITCSSTLLQIHIKYYYFILFCVSYLVIMKCKIDSSARVLFGSFNTIFFACGFLEVVCGFLLLCDSKRILMSRLLASPESGLVQAPFYYLALLLLAAGLLICAAAAMGCWASYMPGYAILTVYFLLVLSLLLGECAAGVLAALWPRCLGLQSARGGAVAALQAYYAAPDYEQFTASVDLVQTELECCGISDARNYEMSVWQLRRLGPRGMFVPPSCCVQHAHNASHLNPAPLHPARCQEVQPNADFRFVPGCMGKLEEWYQQQYLILMLALFIFALFKLGVLLTTIFSCIRLKKRRQIIHSITMRTIDNSHQNLYESKFANIHDEHVTKYIQPNNYTPRARNPRIFPNKPNEMV